jgi:uncharacterized protein
MMAAEPIDPFKNQVERICISVNTRCNYACRYCYFFNPSNPVDEAGSLSMDEIGRILERTYEYHSKYAFAKRIKVNFVGSGEPLLNWRAIADAVFGFQERHPGQDALKFYTVTNGSLITPEIAGEMLALKIMPSVSLDGPQALHDIHRQYRNGNGTFEATMRGITTLLAAGMEVAINTTVTREIFDNLDSYFDFVEEQGFSKVIFDRLVDAPHGVDELSLDEFYTFLMNAGLLLRDRGMTGVEIGNLEAYERNFAGNPDQVCTMFGGSCGAGSHFLIYMGTEVYPCGRMFGKSEWHLGGYAEPIDELQARMADKLIFHTACADCRVAEACVRDCLIEMTASDYACASRQNFLTSYGTLRGKQAV